MFESGQCPMQPGGAQTSIRIGWGLANRAPNIRQLGPQTTAPPRAGISKYTPKNLNCPIQMRTWLASGITGRSMLGFALL